MMAMQTLMENNGLVTGLIYQNTKQPSYQELVKGYSEEPLVKSDLNMDQKMFDELVLCNVRRGGCRFGNLFYVQKYRVVLFT